MAYRDLQAFKSEIHAVLRRNRAFLEKYGKTAQPHLKTYLLESNIPVSMASFRGIPWESFPQDGWYGCRDADGRSWVLDAGDGRLWRIFTLSRAAEVDRAIRDWISTTIGLDNAWLTASYLKRWQKQDGWQRRGIGLQFRDGLARQGERGLVSLKAWHGARDHVPGMADLLAKAEEYLALHSARWQHASGGRTDFTAEVYSNGKITVNAADDVDDVLSFSQDLALAYTRDLDLAGGLRDRTVAPFELTFTQSIDLDAFAEVVSKATQPMRLWLLEVGRQEEDFRRFKGVDLHTWDRVFMDVGPDFAYVTVPGKGCVNAVPRIATIQGEDSAGRVSMAHDGVPLFA